MLNLLQQLQNDSNLLVPINEVTFHANQAFTVLLQMIDSLPQGVFLDFIKNLEYHVSVMGVYQDTLVGGQSQLITQGLYGLTQDSLVYILHLGDKVSDFYIGSASNGMNRISQHLDSLKGLRSQDSVHLQLLASGSLSEIYFSKLYTSVNYFKLAVEQLPYYQFSQGEVFLLRALTEFFVRVLEQSLIFEYKPSINSLNPVLFTYTS